MVDVRLAGMTLLLTMGLLGHPVCALNKLTVGEGIIFGELFQ
jgi:hypothetical protein